MQETPEQLLADAEGYYRKNPGLLDAHERAATILSDHGIRTSARFLTEFARWLRATGPDVMRELIDVYDGVRCERDGPEFSTKNATSAWLTRRLGEDLGGYPGFRITRGKSKMDAIEKTQPKGGANG